MFSFPLDIDPNLISKPAQFSTTYYPAGNSENVSDDLANFFLGYSADNKLVGIPFKKIIKFEVTQLDNDKSLRVEVYCKNLHVAFKGQSAIKFLCETTGYSETEVLEIFSSNNEHIAK